MSVALDPQELLERARQVIDVESAAIDSVSASLDQAFVAVAEVLLACEGKVLITGSGTSGTIAERSSVRRTLWVSDEGVNSAVRW
jgi:arabinose-5-phosphate isomerase